MGFEFGRLPGLPAGAALGEDALQQLRARLGRDVAGAPVRRQRALDSRLEQRLAVLRELLLSRLQLGHAGVEVGQEFFKLGDDAGLFGGGWARGGTLCGRSDPGY
ncbi:hypothetical protein [Acidovorax sp. SRB_24]|uniref:hypothetical protein n=1 Tax=Acidovorax sp. SRB_24 TaxID=1962700 RepID=UPI00145D65E5|nr:hypothetical protein [Acidovorax sp. SRB_24]